MALNGTPRNVPLKVGKEIDIFDTKLLQDCTIEIINSLDPANSRTPYPLTHFANILHNNTDNLQVDDLDSDIWREVLKTSDRWVNFVEGQDVLEAFYSQSRGGCFNELDFKDTSIGVGHLETALSTVRSGSPSSLEWHDQAPTKTTMGKGRGEIQGLSGYSDGDPGPSKRPRESGDDGDGDQPIASQYQDDVPDDFSDEDMSDADPNDPAGERELGGYDDFDVNDLEDTPEEIREQIAMNEMNKVKDSQAVEPFDEVIWQDCCAFFGQDHTNHSQDLIFEVNGLATGLRVYQAYVTY